MGRAFTRVGALVLLLAMSAAAAEQQWVEVTSKHFTVATDGGEKRGKEVALRFEQMRTVFGTVFQKTKVNIPIPLQIIAFRNSKELKQYAPLWKDKPVQLAGFFQGSDDANFIVVDLSAESGWSTVFHEYAHLLLHGNFPPLPLWFDEGFAEYFSTLRVIGKQAEFGTIPEYNARILGESTWMHVEDLFRVQHDSSTYNGGDRRSIFYAESWLVVHYLMSNHRMADVSKYLQLAEVEHVPVGEAIKRAFNVEPKQFDNLLRSYYNGTTKYFHAQIGEFDDGPYVTRKLDDISAAAILADLHAHSRDYQERAVQEFESILKQAPDNAIANRGLGYTYLQKQEFDKAAECFRRAAKDNKRDAKVHYLYALLMNRSAAVNSQDPQKLADMRQELQAALEIDPTLADAWSLLAITRGAEGDTENALSAVRKAIELNPGQELYQVNLANFLAQSRRWDDAEAVLRRLSGSNDARIADMAERNLQLIGSQREVERSYAAGANRPAVDNITAPQWRPKPEPTAQPGANETAATPDAAPDRRKIQYAYGTLKSVDCSAEPAAVLNVLINGRMMKMRTANYRQLILLGADSFSCQWQNKRVLLNYKAGGKADGDIVILELK